MADLTPTDRVVLRHCNLLALAGDGTNITSKQDLLDQAAAEGVDLAAVTNSLTHLEELGMVRTSGNDRPLGPLTVCPDGFHEWASQDVSDYDAAILLVSQWILADVRTNTAIAEKTGMRESLVTRIIGLLIDGGYCRGSYDAGVLAVFDCTERFAYQFDPDRIGDLKRAEPGRFGRFG